MQLVFEDFTYRPFNLKTYSFCLLLFLVLIGGNCDQNQEKRYFSIETNKKLVKFSTKLIVEGCEQ